MRREVLAPLQALAACAIGGAACQFLRAPLPWMIGPLLAPGFESEYRQRVAQAYPRQPDGKTLFPFRRLFIVTVL